MDVPEPSAMRPASHWEDTDGVPVGLPRLVDGPDDRPAQLEPVSLQPEGADIDDEDVMALGSETMEIQRDQLLADDEEWEDGGDDDASEEEGPREPVPDEPIEDAPSDAPAPAPVVEAARPDPRIAVLEARLAAAEMRGWAFGALGFLVGGGLATLFFAFVWSPGTLAP